MLEFVSYCQESLLANEEALHYLLDERGVSMESVKAFMLGYCPSDAKISRDYPSEFQSLKGRITVPIFSEFDELVGIACRAPNRKIKGWWNTSFIKSSHLYGFNDARKHIFKLNKGYIYEGYLDRIILAQFGMPNGVAVMSSSLGMRQVGLLARYCDEVCLVFDTDANDAGRLGMLKTLCELHTVGFGRKPFDLVDKGSICRNISMIKMPVGVDPDEFVIKEGLAAFLALERPLSVEQMVMSKAAYEDLKQRMNSEKRRTRND